MKIKNKMNENQAVGSITQSKRQAARVCVMINTIIIIGWWAWINLVDRIKFNIIKIFISGDSLFKILALEAKEVWLTFLKFL